MKNSNISQLKGVNQSETIVIEKDLNDKDVNDKEAENQDFSDQPNKKEVAENTDDRYYKEFSGELPSQQQTKRKAIICFTMVVIVVFIVLFGTIIYIYLMGTSYVTKKRACPELATDSLRKTNKFEAIFDENQSGWHHTIKFKDIKVVLQAQCPTFATDFEIYVNDALHSRTERTSGDSFKINDCQGNQVYSATFGDGWDSNIFKTDKLSFEASARNINSTLNSSSGNIFVKSPSMWGDDVEMLDKQGAVIGNLKIKKNEKILELSFNNKQYIISDLEVFLVLMAKRFLKGPNDSCNKYFWGVSYFFMSVVALIVAVILFFIIRCLRRWKKQRDLSKKPPESYNQMPEEGKPEPGKKE